MTEQLSQMQTGIHIMREGVLKEGSVMPRKEHRITFPEVKIEVLWYLDLLAASVTGALWHMSTVAHDSFLSATDQESMQEGIVRVLRRSLWETLLIVKSMDSQDLANLQMDYEEAEAIKRQSLPTGHKRDDLSVEQQIFRETFAQLCMVRDQVAEMLMMLGGDVQRG